MEVSLPRLLPSAAMTHHPHRLLLALCFCSSLVTAQKGLYDETILRTLELTFKQSNWQTQLTNNYVSKTYIKADLKVGGMVFKDIGVRYRGNSSYKAVRSIKKPFKIKLDAFGGTEELYGYQTLNLNNGFRDPAFVREVLAYKMFRRIEPASKANWVKLIINGKSYGVYINVEQINKKMLKAWFRDVEGFRYRGERSGGGTPDDPALKWLGTILTNYYRGYELKNANTTGAWQNLMQTCNVLNNTAAGQLHAAAPKIVDIDECIRYLAGNNILPAIDSYIGGTAHNFYLYEDPLHKRTSLLPWDLNATYGGNAWLTVLQKQRLSPWYMTTTKPNRPLLSRVLVDPEWRQRYIAYMHTMMADFYDWKFAGPLVAQYQKLIQAEVQKDPYKLYPFAQFTPSVTQDLQVYIGSRWQWIPGIKPMIDKRRIYLNGLAEFKTARPALSVLTQNPSKPKDQDVVWITAKASSSVGLAWVKLYWRNIGAYNEDPMFDDGKHNDGNANDGVFGLSIPRQNLGTKIEYYVGARSTLAQGGAIRFLPATGGHVPPNYIITDLTTPSPLVVNEVLADNKSVDKDQAGDYDDWAEIHNTSNAPIALAGYYLSDDILNAKKWQFPAGTTIPAKGFVRVWLDNEPNEGKLHATFSLDKDGEEVVLSDASGRILDIMVFGDQKEDRAYGDLPDASGQEFFLWTPTGGAPALGGTVGRTMQFDLRRKGAPSGVELNSTSIPRVGNVLNLQIFKGPPNASAILGISLGLKPIDLGAFGPLLIDATVLVTVPISLDATGFGGLSITIPANAKGFTAYFQAAAQELSNGLAVRFTQ